MGRGRGGVQHRGGGTRGEPGGGVIRETTAYLEGNELGSLRRWEAADLVSRADGIGRELSQGMTTSQIRNFLDEVNRIEAETRRDGSNFDSSRVVLLKPLLAYAAGRETDRNKKEMLTDFAKLFSAAAEKTTDAKDFKKFVDFTRSVVAYHRFHGGSNR